MVKQLHTLVELIDYGVICAIDNDNGLLVTASSEYLTLWVKHTDNSYEARECRETRTSGDNGYYSLNAGDMLDQALEYIADAVEENNNEARNGT